MVSDEVSGGNLKRQLEKLFAASVKSTVPNESAVKPLVANSSARSRKFGDYQCNIAMRICSIRKKPDEAPALGQDITKNLPTSEIIHSCSVTGPGFINIVVSTPWMAKSIENMLMNGIDTWAPGLPVKRAVVDFCSPNIAKEMHVGHIRSTIIGDTIARMLEYSGVEVVRRNHVGDWGTHFGMIIEHLFENFPGSESAALTTIGDLQALYRESKAKFKRDPVFKEKAQRAVVRLQGGDPVYVKPWTKICEISRAECAKVIQRLNVELEEKGESFYKPYIANVIKELDSMGLVEESDGARVIFVQGFSIPLMLVKSDGGFSYDTTDTAALWYRLHEEKAEWIVYVTDAGQQEHFDRLFGAARKAGWLPGNAETYPRASHVRFGVILGEDNKRFRSRDTDIVPLVNLLDEAKTRSKAALIKRAEEKEQKWTLEELDQTAEAVGYGALKYADLKNNRLTSYAFSYDQMLRDKGDTAVYLLYTHTRIYSIIKMSGKDMDELKKTGKIALCLEDERALGLCLLQFAETVEEACTKLLPNLLCEYLYNLSEHFTKFYTNCKVNGSEEETSRLLLCEATAIVMRKCFHLLGITPVYKM
uniref:arginine--tRNA ligase n=1 Tax=Noccaea caerulescens TaxID=107243 RepID=A0A1J3CAN3_NOCCA